MDKLEALWIYQQAEIELETLERSLKNTEVRKKLLHQQKVFQNNQQHLKMLEQETVLFNNKILDVSTQIDFIKKNMAQKSDEIEEIADYDLEDLFLEDVQELVKECEETRNAVEQNKKRLLEVISQLEKADSDAKETLMKMSKAKKAFDKLKIEHTKELSGGKEDLERLKNNVIEAAKDTDPALLEKYKKIKQHRPNPIAHFKNKRCQGCNMELPSGMLQSIRDKEKITICENCGRILYNIDE